MVVARAASKREFKAVIAIWAALMILALAALMILNATSLDVINHIEYVSAGRYQRIRALFHEAAKRAARALQRADNLNTSSDKQVLLSLDDPDYKAAIDLYKRAFAIDTETPYYVHNRKHYEILGQLYDAGGQTMDQIRAAAQAYLCSGDFENAEVYASRISGSEQAEIEKWVLLAEIYLRRGVYTRAEDAITRVQEHGGNKVVVFELRGRLAQKRNDGKADATAAVDYYKTAFSAGLKDIRTRKEAAVILTNIGRTEDAAQVLKEGLSEGADDPNYLDRYAQVLLKLGHNREAIEVFEEAKRLYANSDSILWGLARAYRRTGNLRKSEEAMRQAMLINPALREKALEGN